MEFLAPPKSIPMCEIVDQYDSFFKLALTDQDKDDLIQYLMGPAAPRSDCVDNPRAARDPIDRVGAS
jgi:hypothetical protein